MVAAGVGPPSLDVLMGLVPDTGMEPAVDIAALLEEPGALEEEIPIVDVRSLQYGGAAALARVQQLREVARRTPAPDLPALFEEVCDLVDLAFESGA
jgi:hypothetical protein